MFDFDYETLLEREILAEKPRKRWRSVGPEDEERGQQMDGDESLNRDD